MKKRYTCCLVISIVLGTLSLHAQYSGGGGYNQQQGGNNQQQGYNNQDIQANRQREGHKKVDTLKVDTVPVFNRLLIGADIYDPIATLLGQTYASTGLMLQVDLKDKYFPTLEFGSGWSDRILTNDEHYSGSGGFYGRLGIDVAMLGRAETGLLTIGVRYGFSSFNYNVKNITIDNGYWGESFKGDLLNEKGSGSWFELSAGARARVSKSFYMGWNIRYRFLISSSRTEHSKPFFILGYGPNGVSTIGISYTLYYKLPIKASAKPKPKKRKQPKAE